MKTTAELLKIRKQVLRNSDGTARRESHYQTGADSCSCGEIWPCRADSMLKLVDELIDDGLEMREQLLAHAIVPKTHLTTDEILALAAFLNEGGPRGLPTFDRVRAKTLEAAKCIRAERARVEDEAAEFDELGGL